MASIALPFTPDNARLVIGWGLSDDAPHSHAEIADWCERFWNAFCDLDVSTDIERLMPVLADVETQWDIYVSEFLAHHPGTPIAQVRAPRQWFANWAATIGV